MTHDDPADNNTFLMSTETTVEKEPQTDEYQITVPTDIINRSELSHGDSCRVGLFRPIDEQKPRDDHPHHKTTSNGKTDDAPPVSEGEILTVQTTTRGDEGDAIAKIKGGYTVIVDDAPVGESVIVEIETANPTYAFATLRGGELK